MAGERKQAGGEEAMGVWLWEVGHRGALGFQGCEARVFLCLECELLIVCDRFEGEEKEKCDGAQRVVRRPGQVHEGRGGGCVNWDD